MNVMDWPIKVALKFEQNVHGQTDGDHRHGVDQTHHDEELGTQHRDQFGLAGSAFEEAATEDADAHGCSERTQTHHQGTSDKQHGLSHFHLLLLKIKIKVENRKPINQYYGNQ